MRTRRAFLTVFLCALSVFALLAASPPFAVTPEIQRALDHISAGSLRGHLSFVASDLLEGRGTPSRGLDLAAAYVAAQFRAAGLEPAGDDGYYQTARMQSIRQNLEGFDLTLENGPQSAHASASQAAVRSLRQANLVQVPVFRTDASAVGLLRPADVAGKAVAIALPPDETAEETVRLLAALKPAVVLDLAWKEWPAEWLMDPSAPHLEVPWIALRDSGVLRWLRAARPGPTALRVSLRVPAPSVTPFIARNVIALLRGSDPALQSTYVLVTAHYDHLGIRRDERGGVLYPGANDDGSGTVSVIEIGQALATLRPRPRRSIVFMTFFGEEEGSLGSLYYIHHPVFPLAKTVADLNLEQLGRTDSSAGTETGNATLTGYDFSDLSATLRQAGRLTGVKVYRSPEGGEPYFNRSDNLTFAQHGIPAHTIVVAYEYPDYHAPGDTWQKIDYRNMATVDRMLALAAILVADQPEPPHWNAANPKTAPYRHGGD